MKHQSRMVRKPGKSKLRELSYNFRYRCGEQALRSFVHILPYIPNGMTRGFTRLMARATFIFMRGYRKRMAEKRGGVVTATYIGGGCVPVMQGSIDLVGALLRHCRA